MCKITQMTWPSQRLADKYLGTPGAHVGPSPGLSSSPSRKLRPLQRTYADYRGSGPLPLHVFSYRLPSTHHIMVQFHTLRLLKPLAIRTTVTSFLFFPFPIHVHMHRRMTDSRTSVRVADLSASAPSSAPVSVPLHHLHQPFDSSSTSFLPSRYTCPRRPPRTCTIPFRVPTDIPPLKQFFALQVGTYEGTRGARS